MNGVFIPSRGIGEVYIDVFDMGWRMLSSSFSNFRKNIPFFKLLLDMGSLMMRCYIRLNQRETDAYNIILLENFKEKTTYLMRSYKKIESLSGKLIVTGDIEAYNHYMKVFDQYVQNGKRNFHDCGEMNFTSVNLKDELNKFSFYLDDLLTTLFFFLPKKFRKNIFAVDDYQENMNKIKPQFKIQIMKELGSVIFL